jgi:hypothetical protein
MRRPNFCYLEMHAIYSQVIVKPRKICSLLPTFKELLLYHAIFRRLMFKSSDAVGPKLRVRQD